MCFYMSQSHTHTSELLILIAKEVEYWSQSTFFKIGVLVLDVLNSDMLVQSTTGF